MPRRQTTAMTPPASLLPLPALPASATPWRQALAGLAWLLLGAWAVFSLRPAGARIGPAEAPWVVLGLVLWLGCGLTLAHLLAWGAPAASRQAPSGGGVLPGWAGRTLRKWLAVQGLLLACAAAYAVLPEYQGALYQPFIGLCRRFWPLFSLLALPYLAWVDRRMARPHDLYWSLGDRLLGGHGRAPHTGQAPAAEAWRHLALGWLVKAFFLPMMFGYAVRQVQGLDRLLLQGGTPSFLALFELGIALLYFIDVVWGTLGYLWSLRLTDSQVRSAEPSAAGWALALVCYEPFSRAVWPAYFAYDSAHRPWAHWLAELPSLQLAWGLAILALTAVYALSTVAFGLRFSNLTHRGIITSGPYRWCKHPAYLSKNLSWWLISMPFMVSVDVASSLRCCAMLLGVNLVYWLRARSEERHLSADPTYRAYAAAIDARHRRWAAAARGLLPRVAMPRARRHHIAPRS